MTQTWRRIAWLVLGILGTAGWAPSAGAQDSVASQSAGQSSTTAPEPANSPPSGGRAPAQPISPVAAANSGGGAAEPVAAAAPSSEPEDQPANNDGERSRHFYIDASIGYSWINLVALDQSGLTPDPQLTTSSGMIAEAGLGVQFSVLRLGVAGSYAYYGGFDVATAEVDVALVIPIPIIQPYIEAGIGYGAIMNVDETNPMTMTTAHVPIHGIAIDLGIGFDLAISDVVQFGIGVEASFLNLQRQRVTELGTITNVDFQQPGNSLGLQINGVGRLTFQF